MALYPPPIPVLDTLEVTYFSSRFRKNTPEPYHYLRIVCVQQWLSSD